MNLQFFPDLDHALTGIASAVLQITIGHLLAVAFGYASSPLRSVGRWLIDISPGPLIDITIALLKSADKLVIFWALVLIWLGSAGLAGWIGGPVASATALSLIGMLGLAASLRRPELSRLGALIMAATAAVAGPVAALLVSPTTAFGAAAGALLTASTVNVIRRRLGRGRAISLPVATVPLGALSSGAEFSVAGITPLFTATERFYTSGDKF
jgi:hypothetical protein